ncbi:hypothetical protein [Quadrisphaera sp. DSM 44207]|uniref:hypothetical protein n=1 Tax=Quadrisphaera sp. DSM 44207 TaxID=1881057 RepID=UPI000B897D15|nr:hypothetical protein [Quadrisphaera sp. DSM 44207]
MQERREQQRQNWNRNYPWLFVAAGLLFAWSSFTQRGEVAFWPLTVLVGLGVAAYGGYRVREQRQPPRR